MATINPFLQLENMSLTERLWRRTTDSNIVMASSSPHDVVNNPQSMVAQPVDISDNNDDTAIPLGANEDATSSDPIDDRETFALSKTNGISQQPSSIDASPAQSNNPELSRSTVAEDTEDREVSQDNSKTEINQVLADNQETESYEVASVKSIGVDGSLGSDTETVKVETVGNGKDAVPRYAAKKPAGFKPVSVTKSFLAKAGTPVLPLKAAGDKGVASPSSPAPGSATSATRPRLVAKTLSSSRSAAPKALNSAFKQAGTDGPDPNQVWNRNRVQMAPQATPKHMTDEELRQQYGIQLASRPLEGGDSNQAKWADLEDEDEDWAPETLEWSDGTKINLAPSEPSTPAAIAIDTASSEQAAAQAAAEKAAITPKPSLGPKATVLKLGGGVNQVKAPSVAPASSSAPKMSNEKPTLVAKPSPAPPAKSPWASLPPVEKVSPIVPPVQTSVSRFPHREGYSRDSMPQHYSQPTREIAADDYSRFPANGTPRELFNSHNGRYEPAPDSRRLSMKKDAGFRAPAVLQRPSQNDVNGPVDQSSGHEHSRVLQNPNDWRRRRTSSNVSNDSGSFMRRMSMSRSGPDGFMRRDSVHDQSVSSGYVHPNPENRVNSPANSHGISVTSQQSPMVDHANMTTRPDQYSSNQVPGTPATPMTANMDADVAHQKKLMRERAEAAMRRRKEEEDKEEAEKRERLRLKLLELEPKPSATIETSEQPNADTAATESLDAAQQKSKVASPPKPPAPSTTGEPQQYGLMKLHGVNQSSTSVGSNGRLSQQSPPQEPGSRNDLSRDQNLQHASQIPGTNATDSKLMQKPIPTPIGHQVEKERSVSQGHRLPNQPGSAGYQNSAWGQSSVTSHASTGVNVWAAPGSQKTLGNGDFQKNVTQIHLPQVSSQQYPQHLASTPTQPQPIGTPRQVTHHQPASSQLPNDHQTQAHQYPQELSLHPSHPRVHAQLPVLSKENPALVNLPSSMPTRPPGISAWGDFAKNASVYDAQKKAQLAYDAAALVAERERAGLPINQAPVVHETWTQVARGDTLGTRLIANNNISPREIGSSDAVIPPTSQGSHMRSRYKDLFDQSERSVSDYIRPDAPLTPPPEEDDHPVFMGGSQRPKVKLPGSLSLDSPDKPIPIVRLPSAEAYIVSPSLRNVSPQSNRLPLSPLRHQPLVNSSIWQERFNGLLGNASPVQKRPVEIPGFSTSKEPFEHFQIPRTPVSLPRLENLIPEPFTTKSVEEEMALLEEGRDFGSVPPVRIPIQAPVQAWNPPRLFKDMKRIKAAILTDEQVHGHTPFFPHELTRSGDVTLHIKLPSMTISKQVSYARPATSRQRHSFQGGRGGKSRNSSGQHNGGSKGRDFTSTAAPSSASNAHPTGRLSHHGQGSRKSSAHGHSSNWSNGAKRAAPAPAVH